MLRRRCRRGQSYVEFIMILPLFLLLIAGVIGFGRLLYTRLATEAAAWSGARHAIATMDRDRGVNQAHLASRYTLSGFALDPNTAHTQVSVWGDYGAVGQWEGGAQVRVQVCYDVPAPPVPLGEAISPSRVCSQYAMPVYPWKSSW